MTETSGIGLVELLIWVTLVPLIVVMVFASRRHRHGAEADAHGGAAPPRKEPESR